MYVYIHLLCAGVLAMMWPCGIITSLSELYSAESKSLVYAYLHDFYNDCPDVGSNIRKYSMICTYISKLTKFCLCISKLCSTNVGKFKRARIFGLSMIS